MVPIAYASSEGSDEPAHPRKIASALTAHIHNEGACRGCDFKISKAIEMIGTSRNSLYLLHVCRSMYPTKKRGGEVPPRSHPGSGTANSISSRQRDRVMVHGHV